MPQILTIHGYIDMADLMVGDQVVAYINGETNINTVEGIEKWCPSEMTEVEQEVFYSNHGPFTFYLINGIWKLYKNQSVWVNNRVVHASELQVGDILYNDKDEDILIISIEETTPENEWWKLTISGDHSYISDNLILHNASRYWNKQNASANWNATAPTNWGSASGVADGASVPTSADAVFFDGAGTGGNMASTVSADNTIGSLTFSSNYTSAVTINSIVTLTIAGNFTDHPAHTWSPESTANSVISISATSTITSNGAIIPAAVNFTGSFTTKTLVGDFTVGGAFTLNSASQVINWTTNERLRLKGGHNGLGVISNPGTALISLEGGAFMGSTLYRNNVVIDGNITFSGVMNFLHLDTNISFRHISGTVSTINNNYIYIYKTANSNNTLTLNIGNITLPNIGAQSGSTSTNNSTLTWNLESDLNCTNFYINRDTSGIISNIFSHTFSGTGVVNCNTLYIGSLNTTSTLSMKFKNGLTYNINSLNILGGFLLTRLSAVTISSDDATLKAKLKLTNNCLSNANFTRIDASLGRTINTWNGVVTDCINVNSFTDLKTVGSAG